MEMFKGAEYSTTNEGKRKSLVDREIRSTILSAGNIVCICRLYNVTPADLGLVPNKPNNLYLY